jgi:hypothetical protein
VITEVDKPNFPDLTVAVKTTNSESINCDIYQRVGVIQRVRHLISLSGGEVEELFAR